MWEKKYLFLKVAAAVSSADCSKHATLSRLQVFAQTDADKNKEKRVTGLREG
jgi:hypothetical protein